MLDGTNSEKKYQTNVQMGSIYCVTHIATGRVYVGQTIEADPWDRWINHISFASRGGQTYFCSAIRKYGRDAFIFSVIDKCPVSDLNDLEAKYVAKFMSNIKGFGFNMSDGGDGGRNSLSMEVRAKISQTKTGVKAGPCSPERREAISKAKLAQKRKHSEETLQKIKQKRRAYQLTDHHKRRISEGVRKTRKFTLSADQARNIKDLTATYSDLAISKMLKINRRLISRIRHGVYEGPI